MTYIVKCGNVLHKGKIFHRGESISLNDTEAAGLVRAGIVESTEPKKQETEAAASKEAPKAKVKVSKESDLPSVNLKELVKK